MQEKGQVSIFKLLCFLITVFFMSGDVMCLHQLENHEPVEFGELGIDPVERDQVTSVMLFLILLSMKHFSSLNIFFRI